MFLFLFPIFIFSCIVVAVYVFLFKKINNEPNDPNMPSDKEINKEIKTEVNVMSESRNNETSIDTKEVAIATKETRELVSTNNNKVPTIINDNIDLWSFGSGDNLIFLGTKGSKGIRSKEIEDQGQQEQEQIQPIELISGEDNFNFYINNQSDSKLKIITQTGVIFQIPRKGKMVKTNKINILPRLSCEFSVNNKILTLINSMTQINPII